MPKFENVKFDSDVSNGAKRRKPREGESPSAIVPKKGALQGDGRSSDSTGNSTVAIYPIGYSRETGKNEYSREDQIKTTETRGPGWPVILAAYESAQKAKATFVHEAVICGQMLREQREEIMRCNDGNSWYDRTKPDESGWKKWLAENCQEISQRTAYNWMAAANRVMAHLLEIHHTNVPVWIELDGERHLISAVLTMPDGQATEAMRTFQATFNMFLTDKTLTEAAACVLQGTDPDSRITRAANGKRKGGKGGDRKDFALFIGRKLEGISIHFRFWKNMPEQRRSEIKTVISNMILGEETKLGGRHRIIRPAKSKGQTVLWPEDVCEVALDALRQRLKKH